MTKEAIIECLNDRKKGEEKRKLLAFLREPKTISEMERSGVKRYLFDVIVELKNVDAVAFADGKYFATQIALEALKSLQ